MKIANIFGVQNQEMYDLEDCCMLLAQHLGDYDPRLFNKVSKYVIVDNGLYEGEQNTSLKDIIDKITKTNIMVDEIVVPDVANDYYKNMRMFYDNLAEMILYKKHFRFMVVAQGSNEKEVIQAIREISRVAEQFELRVCIGISKLYHGDRTSKNLIKEYKKCRYPIHFLGLKDGFYELSKVCKVIRSCDTSQLFVIANRIEHLYTSFKVIRSDKLEEYFPNRFSILYRRSNRPAAWSNVNLHEHVDECILSHVYEDFEKNWEYFENGEGFSNYEIR